MGKADRPNCTLANMQACFKWLAVVVGALCAASNAELFFARYQDSGCSVLAENYQVQPDGNCTPSQQGVFYSFATDVANATAAKYRYACDSQCEDCLAQGTTVFGRCNSIFSAFGYSAIWRAQPAKLQVESFSDERCTALLPELSGAFASGVCTPSKELNSRYALVNGEKGQSLVLYSLRCPPSDCSLCYPYGQAQLNTCFQVAPWLARWAKVSIIN